MNAIVFVIAAFLMPLCAAAGEAPEAEYAKLKARAEQLHAEGSYGLANELYLKADALPLPAAEARWVDFRLADTLWRSQAATQTADSTKLDRAREGLEALVRSVEELRKQSAQEDEARDRLLAELHESLGDFWWTRRDARNFGGAWPNYQAALEWWAGARDMELARKRYLHIVWTAAAPPWREPYYYYGYYGNMVPLPVLENALKIATEENDLAQAHYLIAMTLRQQGGDVYQELRIPAEFEAALKGGKKTDWYDDALFHYAQWLESRGRIVLAEDGQPRLEPDYVKAVATYRRLLKEHEKGETRYHDQAKNQIENIIRPVVGASVSHIFLPGSEVEFFLSWRNVGRIDLALYPIDLTRDVPMTHKDASSGNWLQYVELAARETVKEWTKETGDKGDHMPGQEAVRIETDAAEKKLPPGAYVLEAKGGGAGARDLVLVSDASLVLKSAGDKALAYFADAADGSPLAGASVKLWQRYYDGQRWRTRERTLETGGDGLALFELESTAQNHDLFAAARIKERQAFATGSGQGYRDPRLAWKIYAFTDRPAYRPEETVQWKIVARRHDGAAYSTPVDQTIELVILDPRGAKVKEEKVELNAFGSAWGSLELTAAMPLGEYRVNFLDLGRKNTIGSAQLFRLEEYKLPEFQVKIRMPEEDGKKKAFRLGERVEVAIEAEYYFGGPVAGAAAEVLVYQRPFYHYWEPARDYPWYYEDDSPWRLYGGGPGQIVQRETLKTDRAGRALLVISTPANSGNDLEYRIEARVTDASRREIVGSGSARVTRERYYVHLRPEHYLYRPGDKVKVEVKALDANGEPVAAAGTVKVTHDSWVEIWIDDAGKEVPREKAARLKFRGYQHEDVMTATVKTDAEGKGELTFTPARDGYYRIAWASEEGGQALSRPIRAETTVWVATNASTELGYRRGGIEIIADKDTFRAGEEAPVMLAAAVPNRYVLFSVEGEKLQHFRLVHLEGTVKLLHVAIDETHVPNIFLGAAMVSDRQLFVDAKEIVVPPVEHFLDLSIATDEIDYGPREEARLTVTARDHEGKPVAAELALGLVDESVYYIQQEYAGDPRQFFFGEKRGHQVQTQSTFQQKSYAKLKKGEREELVVEGEGRDFQGAELMLRGSGEYEDALVAKEEAGGQLQRLRGAEGKKDMARRNLFFGAQKAAALSDADAAAPAAPAGALAGEPAGAGGQEPPVVVRADFRATALWEPNAVTGEDGTAAVTVKLPDSLTRWKATARAASGSSQFGVAGVQIRTRQPLMVRLQAPRFFLAGDELTISALINNNTTETMQVLPAIEAAGLAVTGLVIGGKVVKGEQGPLSVAAGGEARADWWVSVLEPGEARLKVTARSEKYADAMEKAFTIHEHGIEKFIAKSGKVRGDDITVKIDIPKERKRASTELAVQVTPSMAVTLLDALPYLIDYPYGCTEQTLSRFLPTVITLKTLKEMKLPPEAIAGKIFGGIEPEHAVKTHTGGKRNLDQIDAMVAQGLQRLYDFQHPDGGWGWWKEGESDHFMTAYVVWGFGLARGAGVEVRSDVLERGAGFLDKELVEAETDADLQAWMLHALASRKGGGGSGRAAEGMTPFEAKAFDNLWRHRDDLNAYSRALFALSAHAFGRGEEAKTLARNLESGVKRDEAPDTSIVQRGAQESSAAVIGTAHWGEDGISWRWSEGGVEATAFALRALLAIDPGNKLIEPVTNWLVKNRRGSQWKNTRDTAIAVLALNDYLRQSGELQGGIEYELLVNGRSIARQAVAAADVLGAPSRFTIERESIADGPNEIRIVRRGGKGPIYFAAQARFFSLEEPLASAGSEIFARRQYYKLAGRPTLLKGYVYDREPVGDGGAVASGERVEVVIHVEAKNNAEYLVFEDLKPAGLEAVEVRSGEPLYARELKSGAAERRFKDLASTPAGSIREEDFTGRSRWVYQELRDRKVALFLDKLPEGIWEIRYELRAEVPGKFHALPLLGHAMYVPEIRCNGDEVRIEVKESE